MQTVIDAAPMQPAAQSAAFVTTSLPEQHQYATISRAQSSQEQEQIGRLQSWWYGWFGKPTPKLSEDNVKVHWISLVYMAFMSIFALQVFAWQAFQDSFNGALDGGQRAMAIIIVTAIVGAVAVSDYTAPKAREVAKLASIRGEDGAAFFLRLYAIIVYATDGYAAMTVLYRSTMRLPADTPPPDIAGISGSVIETAIRGTLIIATGWMIHTVTQKQYPSENTLARKGAEITGGEMLRRIRGVDAQAMPTPQLARQFRAFMDAMSRPKRQITIGLWAWKWFTIGSDGSHEKSQWTQLETVLSEEERKKQKALEDELKAAIIALQKELEATKEQAKQNAIPVQAELEDAQRRAEEDAKRRFVSAIIAMMTTGSIPEWVVESYPDLENISLKGMPKARPLVARSSNNGADKSDLPVDYRDFFGHEVPKKIKKKDAQEAENARGIWINSTDIPTLTDARITIDEARELALKYGGGAKNGTALAAPLREILKDKLVQSHLIEPWKSWQSAQIVGNNSGKLAATTQGNP